MPDLKANPLVAQLDSMRQKILQIQTGGWRIPPKGDPFWTKVLEMNKALEVIARAKG